MTKKPRDTGASVRARLLNLSRERAQPFELRLTRYASSRSSYRLSVSTHRDRFVLKGALLITTWFDNPHRPTRDLDLLGFGESSAESIVAAFRDVCSIEQNDGVTFDVAALRVTVIREELKYGGLRLSTTVKIAGARLRVIVDIGFADAIEPGLEEIDLPVFRRDATCTRYRCDFQSKRHGIAYRDSGTASRRSLPRTPARSGNGMRSSRMSARKICRP